MSPARAQRMAERPGGAISGSRMSARFGGLVSAPSVSQNDCCPASDSAGRSSARRVSAVAISAAANAPPSALIMARPYSDGRQQCDGEERPGQRRHERHGERDHGGEDQQARELHQVERVEEIETEQVGDHSGGALRQIGERRVTFRP